jgi:hypothetical protein
MALQKLANGYLPVENVPGAPPPDGTHNTQQIDLQPLHPTCTSVQTMPLAYLEVVGEDNTDGKVSGKPIW